MNKKSKHEKTRDITQMAMLFALALVLMVIEGAIPPIPTMPPGVKLGLSNIVVMYTLFFMGKRQALTILILKSCFVFLTRGVVAFAMSFCGGLFSILILFLLLSLKKVNISYIIASVAASISHNIGQILISSILLQNTAVFYYLPVLLISGVFMGVLTGTMLKVILPAMKHIRLFDNVK